MPVLLEGVSHPDPAPWLPGPEAGCPATAERGCIEIGLVNNMPDAALQATERQFVGLLAAAAGDIPVRMHFFSLPGVPRGDAATAHIASRYGDVSALDRTPLHGLIVTGCEPRAASLADEPYWDSLVRLVDWAETNTISTIWSCLAAHAAVLAIDGIGRRPLRRKLSGVYACAGVAADPLLAGAPAEMLVAHSRWNDLAAADLAACGYEVLTRSPQAGVDMFVRQRRSRFVFFQGHPEYDADSIAREYRRDAARYLRAERDGYPGLPHDYFDRATETALEAFQARATADRTAVALRDMPRPLMLRPGLKEGWQGTVLPVFGNWLTLLAGTEARAGAADPPAARLTSGRTGTGARRLRAPGP